MDIEIIIESDLSPAEIGEIAVAAEQGGIRTIWHSNLHAGQDAFVALAPAAMATNTIKLGVLAVSPYEMHPIKIANAILSLNELANGRAIVAIGAGGAVLSATGDVGVYLDYKKLRAVRGVREAVEIVRDASSGELTRGYQGEIFQVTLPAHRTWAKAPPPGIFTCSNAPQMFRMGGRVADGLQMGDVTMHRLPEAVAETRAGLAQRTLPEDDFRIGNYWAWHIKADRDKSMHEARRSLVWRTQMVPPFHGLSHMVDDETAQFVRDHFENFARAYWTGSGIIEGVPEDLVNELIALVSSSGDFSDIDHEIERYREYAETGITDLALKIFDDPMDSVKVISERVVPAFAQG